MATNPVITTALDAYVEREYAAGISAPYSRTLIHGVLALASVGYAKVERMRTLAACILGDMTELDREAIRNLYIIPGQVSDQIGNAIWPDTLPPEDNIGDLTTSQETAYRKAMINSVNSYAEAQARRVITSGFRKQHAYQAKLMEAQKLLGTSDPGAEDPANYPFLQGEASAEGEPTIVSVANIVVAKGAIWVQANAAIEAVCRATVEAIKTADVGDIAGLVATAQTQVSAAIDTLISSE